MHLKPLLTLYTIGHSNITTNKLVELLQKYQIQATVDEGGDFEALHDWFYTKDGTAIL